MYGLGLPTYSTYALMTAPLIRSGYQTQTGASAFALDWIGGGTFHSDHVGVRVGYADSVGLYGAVSEQRSGFFLSSVVRGQGSVLGQLQTGLDRVRLTDVLGLTSAYIRDIPYGAGTVGESERSLLPDSGSLRTIHLEQDNLLEGFDVCVAQAIAPIPQLHTAQLGVHTPGYHESRDGEGGRDGEGFRVLARAGMAALPAQAAFGVEAGMVWSARLEADATVAGDAETGFHIGFGLLYNDAEQLAMYPYTQNVLTYRYQMTGEFCRIQGEQTIRVQGRTADGRRGQLVELSLVYDGRAPVDGTVTATPQSPGVVLSWEGFADRGSDIDHYEVVFDEGTAAPYCSAGPHGAAPPPAPPSLGSAPSPRPSGCALSTRLATEATAPPWRPPHRRDRRPHHRSGDCWRRLRLECHP